MLDKKITYTFTMDITNSKLLTVSENVKRERVSEWVRESKRDDVRAKERKR
jgi:hypothetical protein